MTNDELIQALKEDAEWASANEWETPITLGDHLDAAADLIESLQAQLAEYEALAAEYGIDGQAMLTLAKSQIATAADNVKLMEQLSASRRREKAVVEDLYEACRRSPCNSGICVKKNCSGNIIPCEFEWRGPQAGKGGQDD